MANNKNKPSNKQKKKASQHEKRKMIQDLFKKKNNKRVNKDIPDEPKKSKPKFIKKKRNEGNFTKDKIAHLDKKFKEIKTAVIHKT